MAHISFQPKDYFNMLTYDGNGSTNARTGLGFEPDFIWIKNHTNDHDHYLFDQVRGTTKYIRSNVGNAEGTASGVTSFDSDGFTLGSSDGMNENGRNFLSFNWRASGTQGSSNTDGSINTTYTSVNTNTNISICKWTGSGANATIGHGLGVTPHTYWVKNLDTSDSWNVYHHGVGNTHRLFLDTDGGDNNDDTAFNDTSPTSSVFSVGTNTGTNKSSINMIAYVFANKKGFSKFGDFTGNGNTDGAFVYTGFKPAFVMLKCSSHASSNWGMHNTTIDVDNPIQKGLIANTAAAQDTHDFMDICSNGFKLRSSSNNRNGDGRKYLYWAWAKEPMVASNNDVSTAY